VSDARSLRARETEEAEKPAEKHGPAKSAQAFRTISEASDELAVPAHVLRFWETKFPALSPLKRGGRRRYYRPTDMAFLRGIRALLYDEGLTIKGVQKVLRERGVRYVVAFGDDAERPPALDAVAAPTAPSPPSRRERLLAVAVELEALRDRLRA